MKNQNWQFATKFMSATVATLLVSSLPTLAAAQHVEAADRSAIFAAAPRVQTSVKGVTTFAAPPKGFNPLNATSKELLSYGLPEAPDKDANPTGFAHWQKSMQALKTHATDVKAMPYTSREMMPANGGAAPQTGVDGTVQYTSGNWSGIANTNKLTKWNAKTSFDEVVSFWNVPVPNHPLGNIPCSDGPWFEVTWNGIDGFNNGDVVQGGTADYWDGGGCGGPVQTYGWVEWYPSYSILAIYCGSSLCTVNPGDDFEAVSFGAPGTSEQFVFVEDITQQWSGTFGMNYVTGPGVVGSSAEYIVERPCCNGSNLYPLGNYIFEFLGYNYAYDGAGTLFYPGNTSVNTAIITMLADDGSTDISFPFLYGTAGNAGRYSIMMEDENCAYVGGCTP
jgi:hypothetical protein